MIKKQIEWFFLQNLAIEGYPIVTLPTTPIFPHKGDNSVSSGNNKNNTAVSPAGWETLAENLRFQRSTDEYIEKLLHEKDSLSTKRATKGALMCLQQYLLATNREVDLESCCSSELQLSAMLVNFYADVRKKKGAHYKLSALKSIRFGLARHFSSEHGIDIIKDPTFKRANEVFYAVCVGLKRAGLGKVDHTPSLEENDLKYIYCSTTMSAKTPTGLQHETWFDIMYFLCRRGRENLSTMTKDTFKVATDSHGREYVYQHKDELDKNHRENVDSNQSVTEGRMYVVPGKKRLIQICILLVQFSHRNKHRTDIPCPVKITSVL